MNDEYMKAHRAGEREYRARLAKGRLPYAEALDEILPENGSLSRKSLGLMEIPVEKQSTSSILFALLNAWVFPWLSLRIKPD